MSSMHERFSEFEKLRNQGRDLLEASAHEEARQKLEEARQLLEELYRQATSELSPLIERAGRALVEKNIARGDFHLSEDGFDLAREHYSMALDFAVSAGDREEALIRLGKLEQREAPQETLDDLSKKLEKDPDSPELLYEFATTLALEGFLPEAVRHFEKLASLTPDNSDVYYRLGNAYFDSRRYDDARTSYEKALKLGFEDKAELYYREGALVFHERGDHPTAKKHYRLALEANAEHLDALKGLAHLNILEENFKDAIDLLNRAREADPEDEEIREDLIELFQGMHRYDEAVLECNRAIEQFRDPEAREKFSTLKDEVDAARTQYNQDRRGD